MEVKPAHDAVARAALDGRIAVLLNGRRLWIGPLEMQVAFKLLLGGDKDIEDARHLWGALRERLKRSLVESWMRELGVPAHLMARLGP